MAAAGALAAYLPRIATAGSRYPEKVIRVVVTFAAGGGTDVLARLLGQRVSMHLEQNVLIDNRAGAGGTMGTTQVAQAASDGYTLLLTSLAPITIAPNLPGMPVRYQSGRDFLPVAMVAQQPVLIVVNARVPASDLRGLFALARQRPGQLSYGTPGIGTELHLIGEMLKLSAGIDIVHVPCKGGGPAISDLVGGTIDMMPVVTSSIMPFLKSGAIRALATTGKSRVNALPDVPTVAEWASATWWLRPPGASLRRPTWRRQR